MRNRNGSNDKDDKEGNDHQSTHYEPSELRESNDTSKHMYFDIY